MFSNHPEYLREVRVAAETALPWEKLQDTSLLLTGATGLVGTFLVDTLLWKNEHDGLGCHIYAVGRSEEHARERFGAALGQDVTFVAWDVNDGALPDVPADYVIHAASNTHPRAYASDPVGSILTNIIGLRNVLDFSRKAQARRTLFLSSVEVYGKAWKSDDVFDESYCGYIDCNTLRAGYPEGKRAGEALCQAYRAAYGLDIVIPRLSRVYGPTMQDSDSKAMAQFFRRAAAGEDIILKSAGTQRFSYTYVPDAVTGILTCLLRGEDGEVYNVAGTGDMTLREIAGMIADVAGTKVVFVFPDDIEEKGYSRVDVALMKTMKIENLGWKAQYDLKYGITFCSEAL